jgi:hypothetical protein
MQTTFLNLPLFNQKLQKTTKRLVVFLNMRRHTYIIYLSILCEQYEFCF